MSVTSYEHQFHLDMENERVPPCTPFRRHIQAWYDELFSYSDTIFITVHGMVWTYNRGVIEVVVVYDFIDLDDGTEEREEWLEFEITPRRTKRIRH